MSALKPGKDPNNVLGVVAAVMAGLVLAVAPLFAVYANAGVGVLAGLTAVGVFFLVLKPHHGPEPIPGRGILVVILVVALVIGAAGALIALAAERS